MASLNYLDYSHRDDRWSGGSRMIPITTPFGDFSVWTKRVGNNPNLKVLLLHGGPAFTAQYWECCDSFFPAAGIEYYYYDQLGCFRSDQPDDDRLWTIEHFVEEVEQVRKAIGADASNFVVMGHSWGGVLAIEYALKYQQHLKGMVISNMMSSIPAYNDYARSVLMPKMDQAKLARVQALEAAGDFDNPEYEEILFEIHYVHHVLRRPVEEWPDPVMRSFVHANKHIYTLMQGPSELGASGLLVEWDRTNDLEKITVPALVIGGEHDTMDPRFLAMMASKMPQGRSHTCPEGSHMALYDDQDNYFAAVTSFLHSL
jgi:proline iminopeptidase